MGVPAAWRRSGVTPFPNGQPPHFVAVAALRRGSIPSRFGWFRANRATFLCPDDCKTSPCSAFVTPPERRNSPCGLLLLSLTRGERTRGGLVRIHHREDDALEASKGRIDVAAQRHRARWRAAPDDFVVVIILRPIAVGSKDVG